MLRWLYPEAEAYLKTIPLFMENYCGDPSLYEKGTGVFVSAGVKAALLWKPVDAGEDKNEVLEFLVRSVHRDIRRDTERVFTEIAGYHPSNEPYWYFTMLGVDPAYRRFDFAEQLVLRFQSLCDEAKKPWYGDATSERTARFYERLGAEIIGVAQHGSSPPFYVVGRRPELRQES